MHTITASDRLVVRQLVAEDAAFLYDLHSQPGVTEPLGMMLSTGVEEELQRIERFRDRFGEGNNFGVWGLGLIKGDLVGLVLLKRLRPSGDHGYEVGWRLHPDFWGHGYATEGASALLELAFVDRNLSEVFALIEPSNDRSHRVADRIGMRTIGTIEFRGLPHDLLSITVDQWHAQQ